MKKLLLSSLLMISSFLSGAESNNFDENNVSLLIYCANSTNTIARENTENHNFDENDVPPPLYFANPTNTDKEYYEYLQLQNNTKSKNKYICAHTKYKNTQTLCMKSFPTPSKLMRHSTVHTGEHPFECTKCHQKFTQNSSLNVHISYSRCGRRINRNQKSQQNVQANQHTTTEKENGDDDDITEEENN